ncbi:MAG: primosomal protein N' [Gammaproteobacteria bacterium HGW-Gammaproteobacteria-3]|nr:MAG: primosomal protein N' [Gammaproteobacteria bacterium HGW-Gammaproteobacteria-3]
MTDDRAWILKVAVPIGRRRLFDYLAPEGTEPAALQPGARVRVPFGNSSKIAFLIAVSFDSEVDRAKLKSAEAILDVPSLLNATDIELLLWTARYYHHPLGEVFSTAFPVTLRRGKPALIQAEQYFGLTPEGRTANPDLLMRAPRQQCLLAWFQTQPGSFSTGQIAGQHDNWRPAVKALLARQWLEPRPPPDRIVTAMPVRTPELQANASQQTAIDAVTQALGGFRVFLLEGVTGSGKTEVYMQIIRSVLERGQQVLVLLPEITLTPQLQERFRQRFAVPVTVAHSKLTDKQRQAAWLEMQQGVCAILLGTRSALFTPLKKPGLIILDEEHDASFKQQEGFRFSARDVAVARGKMLQIPVLLGSATPSLESYYNVEIGRYQWLHLPERAGDAQPPNLHLLDIRNKRMQEGLSQPLITQIHRTLDKQEQVLLFLNRRGFAPTLICHACAWIARCSRCDANLVIHYAEDLLRCHHCGFEQGLLRHCPACKSGQLTPLGLGTERIEQVLTQLFPGKTVVRLDRDSTQRKGQLESYLEQIQQGRADIILGTQMLAKGHHFPNVTLVVLLDVDSGLFSIDFHGTEKLAQLIVQVSGRAGRAQKRGQVILQTRQPDHPLLAVLLRDSYRRFLQLALAERKAAHLPPYSFQALLRVEAAIAQEPLTFFANLDAPALAGGQVQILGPVSAPMARKAGRYRYQMLFQSAQRRPLHLFLDALTARIENLKQSRKIRWSLDVDPVDLY